MTPKTQQAPKPTGLKLTAPDSHMNILGWRIDDDQGHWIQLGMKEGFARHVFHCVNSHDALVKQNGDLLEALKLCHRILFNLVRYGHDKLATKPVENLRFVSETIATIESEKIV